MKNNELNLIMKVIKLLDKKDKILRTELLKKYQEIFYKSFKLNGVILTEKDIEKKSIKLYNIIGYTANEENMVLFKEGKKFISIYNNSDCKSCKYSITKNLGDWGFKDATFKDIDIKNKICISCRDRLEKVFDVEEKINNYCKSEIIKKAKKENLFSNYAYLHGKKINTLITEARKFIILRLDDIISDVYINFNYKEFKK